MDYSLSQVQINHSPYKATLTRNHYQLLCLLIFGLILSIPAIVLSFTYMVMCLHPYEISEYPYLFLILNIGLYLNIVEMFILALLLWVVIYYWADGVLPLNLGLGLEMIFNYLPQIDLFLQLAQGLGFIRTIYLYEIWGFGDDAQEFPFLITMGLLVKVVLMYIGLICLRAWVKANMAGDNYNFNGKRNQERISLLYDERNY